MSEGAEKFKKKNLLRNPLDLSQKESYCSFQTAVADRAPGRPSPNQLDLASIPDSGEVRAGSQFGEIKGIFHEEMEIGVC